MPFIVYYPVYIPAPVESVAVAAAKVEVSEEKKDNVVSIYDYLGEI